MHQSSRCATQPGGITASQFFPAIADGRRAAGALLFTCNGRGSRLFAEPDHDAGLLAEVLGKIPVAGFFCAGELGPVGGQNFLHAYTASIALFPDTAV